MSRSKHVVGPAGLALVAVVWACGTSSPADVGQNALAAAITAVVHDSAAVLPPGRSTMPPADSVDYDGVATGNAELEVYSDGGGWTSLGDASAVMFDVYCEDASVVHADASVAPETYSKVRLTLSDFDTSMLAGAVIAGITYADPFVITFEGGDPVVIEKTVTPFTLEDGDSITILVDLNTELWLDADVVDAEAVTASEIAAAANVIIR